MNFIQKLTHDLCENGLNEVQAAAIILLLQEDKSYSMSGRWLDSCDAYPAGLYNVVWEYCKSFALKYIDANCPKAWFRGIFDPSDPIHAQFAKS